MVRRPCRSCEILKYPIYLARTDNLAQRIYCSNTPSCLYIFAYDQLICNFKLICFYAQRNKLQFSGIFFLSTKKPPRRAIHKKVKNNFKRKKNLVTASDLINNIYTYIYTYRNACIYFIMSIYTYTLTAF